MNNKHSLNVAGIFLLSISLGLGMYALSDSALGGIAVSLLVLAIACLEAAFRYHRSEVD